jgi:hypothetical protein
VDGTIRFAEAPQTLLVIDFSKARPDASSNIWMGDGDLDRDGVDDGLNVTTVLSAATVNGSILEITGFNFSFDHPDGGTVVAALTGTVNLTTGEIQLSGVVTSEDTPGVPKGSLVELAAQGSPIGADPLGQVDGTIRFAEAPQTLLVIDFSKARPDANSNIWMGDGDLDRDGVDDGLNVTTVLSAATVNGSILEITGFNFSFDHPDGGTVVAALTGTVNLTTGEIQLSGVVTSEDTPGVPKGSLVELAAQGSPIGADPLGQVDGTIRFTEAPQTRLVIDFSKTRPDANSNTWTGDGDIDGDGVDDGLNVITVLNAATVNGNILEITDFDFAFDHPDGGTVVAALTGTLNLTTGQIKLSCIVTSVATHCVP